MSDTIELSLLSNLMQGVDRDFRLMRLRVDTVVRRLAALEQSFHDLVVEVGCGPDQVQRQMPRREKRIDAVDAGLSSLRAELADKTARIIAAIGTRS